MPERFPSFLILLASFFLFLSCIFLLFAFYGTLVRHQVAFGVGTSPKETQTYLRFVILERPLHLTTDYQDQSVYRFELHGTGFKLSQ